MKLKLGLLILTLSISTTIFASELENLLRSYNFGVVINNSNYQIYRSAYLGKKGLKKVWKELKEQDFPTPKTIVYMNDEGYKGGIIGRFRGGKYALKEYKYQKKYGYKFYHSFDYTYRTYLDGHNPYYPEEDIDTKNKLSKKAIKIFGEDPNDGIDGGYEAFRRIMKIVLDPQNQPVLFHCHSGKHRTGMVGLAIRYIQGGQWTGEFDPDHSQFDQNSEVVADNLAQKEYLNYTKGAERIENIDFIETWERSEDLEEYVRSYRRFLNQGCSSNCTTTLPR